MKKETRKLPTFATHAGFTRELIVPKLRVLNLSGGRQSTTIAEMIIHGDLPPVDLCLTADTGMEHEATYAHIKDLHKRLNQAGIKAAVAPGPNLWDDLVTLGPRKATRLDNPPYWVQKENGGRGRLVQKCTKHYKIAPMDRYIRQELLRTHGINPEARRIGHNIVEKWIGFSADETSRMKLPGQKYVYFGFPLVDLGFNKDDCISYLEYRGRPVPPPSVCVACFSNPAASYKTMGPTDFERARAVDESLSQWAQIGIKGDVYVSKTLRRLSDIRADEETEPDTDEGSCDGGYCFV